jgi:hypothetical protein
VPMRLPRRRGQKKMPKGSSIGISDCFGVFHMKPV